MTPALRLVKSPVTKLAMASHKAVLMMAQGMLAPCSRIVRNDAVETRMRKLRRA